MAIKTEKIVKPNRIETARILIVDDEPAICKILSRLMKREGYDSTIAQSGDEALKIIRRDVPNVLLLDFSMPGMNGLEVIENVKKIAPDLPIVMITAYADINGAVEAMRKGAYDYLAKPFENQELIRIIRLAASESKFGPDQKPQLRKNDGFHGIVGVSEKMKAMFETIKRVASCEHGNVLLQGESGTGKELVAKAIHNLTTGRSRHNFVPVNCAAIPDDLLESELFGYEKGAFTGASRSKTGRLQHADQGTLFLDEIGDMKPGLQAKLLRVLQEQIFEPIGSVNSVKINIRVIAATNSDLESLIQTGKFREDLFYRLNVVPIKLPPLRERKEDIAHLIEKFLLMYNRGRKTSVLRFSSEAMKRLNAYDWPGNVRELQNLVQRMYILHNKPSVEVDDLPEKFKKIDYIPPENRKTTDLPDKEDLVEKIFDNAEGLDFQAVTMDFENRLILQALCQTNWNKKEAAEILKMKRTTLLEKIKRRNLDQEKENCNLEMD